MHQGMIWLEWLKLLADNEGGIKDYESDDLGGTIPPGEDHSKSDGNQEENEEGEEDDDEECSSNDDKAGDLDNDGK